MPGRWENLFAPYAERRYFRQELHPSFVSFSGSIQQSIINIIIGANCDDNLFSFRYSTYRKFLLPYLRCSFPSGLRLHISSYCFYRYAVARHENKTAIIEQATGICSDGIETNPNRKRLIIVFLDFFIFHSLFFLIIGRRLRKNGYILS